MAKDPDRRFATAAALRDVLLQWAGGEPDMPLDQQNDATFQRAVAALEAAEVNPELARDVIVAEAVSDLPPKPEGQREYLWIIMSLVGFWVFLLLVLGIVMLAR